MFCHHVHTESMGIQLLKLHKMVILLKDVNKHTVFKQNLSLFIQIMHGEKTETKYVYNMSCRYNIGMYA